MNPRSTFVSRRVTDGGAALDRRPCDGLGLRHDRGREVGQQPGAGLRVFDAKGATIRGAQCEPEVRTSRTDVATLARVRRLRSW